MIMFSRINKFAHTSLLRNHVARKTRTVIQFDNGSEIVALPASENMLRGYTAHMIVADECAFMPEDLVTDVIFPMLSTTDGYAVFLSTPWGRNHFFYRAFMNPDYSVHRVKSSMCPLIKSEFLDEMRRNMTEQAYKMEYEAEFAEAADSYFSQDLIRSCVNPNLKLISTLEHQIPEGEHYCGCDFGKLQDHSVVTVLNRRGDKLDLVYMNEFPTETPYTNVIGHLVRAHERFQFRSAHVDQTGVGEPVLEELKNQNVPAEGLVFTAKTKEELLSCLKIVMEQRRISVPYHLRLCQQINEQKCAYTKSGHLQFSHPEGSHDDMLWSLALAAWAATMRRETQAKIVKAW